jgi:hypothetical protein
MARRTSADSLDAALPDTSRRMAIFVASVLLGRAREQVSFG